MADVTDRLETIFMDLLPRESGPIARWTKLKCASWDSLFHLNLIVAIEQEFQVRLTDDDIMDLTSFEAAVKIVEQRLTVRHG